MSTTGVLRLLAASSFFFFFNDTATTEIYTLSLHDALPISTSRALGPDCYFSVPTPNRLLYLNPDRKSTRLNSSHSQISYAVFCLKKKKILPTLGRSDRDVQAFCEQFMTVKDSISELNSTSR